MENLVPGWMRSVDRVLTLVVHHKFVHMANKMMRETTGTAQSSGKSEAHIVDCSEYIKRGA